MNINPIFTKKNQQLMRRLMENNSLDFPFPKRTLCLFSMAQFVRNRLFAPMKPSTRNNSNEIVRLRHEFLKRCSMKFGLYLSPQFIIRGRSNAINPRDVIQFQSTASLQNQLLALSNYGTATLLGNTTAIAEISYRLSKTPMYNEDGLIYAYGMSKVILLVEYGISLGCPDCLGLMAYVCCIGYGYNSKERNVLKLAGQSAEAGSIYGWFALARLLKDNSDRASYHDRYDDAIDIDECDLGVRQFVCSRIPLDEQIRRALEEHGCKLCLPQFYDGKERCCGCGFEFDVFNYYQDDDDTSVPKSEQMRIAVDIYYKILSENPQSHPICIDSRKNLVKIYKARERLFGESIEATDDEIRRLEEI